MLKLITNILRSHIFRIVLPIVFLFKLEALNATSYGQLSSLTTQAPTSAGTNLVKMEMIDEILNLEVGPKKDKVIIKEDGVYLIIASGQVGAITSEASGYMDLWFIKNGKSIPNSGCRMSISDSTQIGVVVSQAALTLKAGDTISAGYSSSGPSLGFIFIQPDNEPAITSFLFSIIKISENSKENGTPPTTKQSAKK